MIKNSDFSNCKLTKLMINDCEYQFESNFISKDKDVTIFDFTMQSDGKKVDFNGGTVTVTIPWDHYVSSFLPSLHLHIVQNLRNGNSVF